MLSYTGASITGYDIYESRNRLSDLSSKKTYTNKIKDVVVSKYCRNSNKIDTKRITLYPSMFHDPIQMQIYNKFFADQLNLVSAQLRHQFHGGLAS